MAGMIVTARHGRPNVDRSVKITAREYAGWWANYDLAGLAPGETPPPALVDVASRAKVVLTSTLPRAIETAAAATEGRVSVPQDAMFVEAPLPAPAFFPSFIKLTPTTWGVISRFFWFLGFAPGNTENHIRARRRVADIAERLVKEASAPGEPDILLCAHGYLNWMIHQVMKKRGWVLVDHQGGNHYWSYRVYRRREDVGKRAGSPKETTRSMAAE